MNENLIYKFLNNPHLFKVERSKFIDNIYLIHKFEDYEHFALNAYDNICKLVDKNPQLFLEITKQFLKKNQSLTTIMSDAFRFRDTNIDKNFGRKLDKIALFWENCELFRLVALAINGKCELKHLKEKEAILKNFNFIGLNTNKIKKIREIRNAKNHKFTFNKTHLIDNENKEVATFEDIEDIIEVIKDIVSWTFSFFLLTIYSNSHFLSLLFFGLRNEIVLNKIVYVEYLTTFHRLFEKEKPNEEKEKFKSELEEMPMLSIWIAKAWKFIKSPVKETKRYYLQKTVGQVVKNILRFKLPKPLVMLLISTFQQRVGDLSKEMLFVSNKLENNDDKYAMRRFAIEVFKDSKRPINSTDELSQRIINLIGEQVT